MSISLFLNHTDPWSGYPLAEIKPRWVKDSTSSKEVCEVNRPLSDGWTRGFGPTFTVIRSNKQSRTKMLIRCLTLWYPHLVAFIQEGVPNSEVGFHRNVVHEYCQKPVECEKGNVHFILLQVQGKSWTFFMQEFLQYSLKELSFMLVYPYIVALGHSIVWPFFGNKQT